MTGAIVGLAFLIGFFGGWPAVALAATFACLLVLAGGWRVFMIPLVTLALVAGAIRAPSAESMTTATSPVQEARVFGVVSSSVVDDGRIKRFTLDTPNFRVCARMFARLEVGRGDALSGTITVTPAESLPDSYRSYLRSHGCDLSGTMGSVELLGRGSGATRWIDSVRQAVTRMILGWVPGDRGVLLAGLVTGDDALMWDELTEAFVRT